MGQNFYNIKLCEFVIAEKVRKDYVPIIIKALMSEYFSDPELTINIIRDKDLENNDET